VKIASNFRSFLLGAALAAPALASAQADQAGQADVRPPLGITLRASLGGGGSLGGGSEFTPSGLFEGEVVAGYELPQGFRPELGFAAALAPVSHIALRPGLHYSFPDMPFYGRVAFDFATTNGFMQWRWFLFGGGAEVRLTGLLGAFGEVLTGIPVQRSAGVPLAVRAGATFRF
jgi:hypothetical protein